MKQSLPSPAVLVIDTMQLRRAGVVSLLRPWADAREMNIIEAHPDGAISTSTAVSFRVIVRVMGAIGVSDPEARDWIRTICRGHPGTPLVLLSDQEEAREIVSAFDAGVRGFIPTNIPSPVAIQILTFIVNGGSYFPPAALLQSVQTGRPTKRGGATGRFHGSHDLTARQKEVLEHLRSGASNKVIGRQLALRESTVKVHIRQIMRKLGAVNRTQAALCAAQIDHSAAGSKDAASGMANGALPLERLQMISTVSGKYDGPQAVAAGKRSTLISNRSSRRHTSR